jgi:hypothetical protein
MGDHDDAAPPAGRRGRAARRAHPRPRPDHPLIIRRAGCSRSRGAGRGRDRAAERRGPAAADDDGREDPRRHLVGAAGGALRAAGRRRWSSVDGGYSHEFTTAQVHYFLEQEYGPTTASRTPSVRRLRGSPDLRRRGRRCAPSSTRSRPCASCSASSRPHRRARLLGRGRRLARHLPRGGARADDRARGLRPGHRQPHLHGGRQQRPHLGRGRRPSTPPRLQRASRSSRCRSRSASSWSASCGRTSPPRT